MSFVYYCYTKKNEYFESFLIVGVLIFGSGAVSATNVADIHYDCSPTFLPYHIRPLMQFVEFHGDEIWNSEKLKLALNPAWTESKWVSMNLRSKECTFVNISCARFQNSHLFIQVSGACTTVRISLTTVTWSQAPGHQLPIP